MALARGSSQKLLENNFGKDTSKANSGDIEAIAKPYRENNEYKLLDPLKIEKIIENLNNDIDNFLDNVNSALTDDNARTNITFED